MHKEVLRIGLIGCGEVCEHKHMPALHEIEGAHGAPIAALLAETRAAAARDFASGTVVALDGSRLARAEAAFALACYESLSAAGRGCG